MSLKENVRTRTQNYARVGIPLLFNDSLQFELRAKQKEKKSIHKIRITTIPWGCLQFTSLFTQFVPNYSTSNQISFATLAFILQPSGTQVFIYALIFFFCLVFLNDKNSNAFDRFGIVAVLIKFRHQEFFFNRFQIVSVREKKNGVLRSML